MCSSWHIEKMKLLLLFPFLEGPIWVSVAAEPPFLSPRVSPLSPASMAAFSPDIQVENEWNRTDSGMKVLIALIVAGTALGAVILSLLCFCVCNKKSPSKFNCKNVRSSDAEKGLARTPFTRKSSSLKVDGKMGSISIFDHKTIAKATNNFLESNILGEGGFGCVYKARLHNLDVAVKKLQCESQDAQREFQNEVDLLSKIQHPNIISLLGFSSNGDARFIVYELMQNGSLETHLHGPSHGSALTWHMRMKIALDIARGLEYLHEVCNPPVIHRDLKSSNILLDANFINIHLLGYKKKKKMSLVRGGGYSVPRPYEHPSRGQIWDGPYDDQELRAALTSSHIEWKDTPEAHLYKVHLPGLRPEEVKVEVEEHERAVIITGEKKVAREGMGYQMERITGRLVQRLSLPENAKLSLVKAYMENGVLSVTVPKYEVANYYNQARRPRLVHISGN